MQDSRTSKVEVKVAVHGGESGGHPKFRFTSSRHFYSFLDRFSIDFLSFSGVINAQV